MKVNRETCVWRTSFQLKVVETSSTNTGRVVRSIALSCARVMAGAGVTIGDIYEKDKERGGC